jgi:hypothetical protein
MTEDGFPSAALWHWLAFLFGAGVGSAFVAMLWVCILQLFKFYREG